MIGMATAVEAAGAGVETTTMTPARERKDVRRFDDVLGDLVRESDELHKTSHEKLKAFERGEVQDVHEVMMAMSKSDLSFRMMLEVRGKLLEAYQTVMRMQV